MRSSCVVVLVLGCGSGGAPLPSEMVDSAQSPPPDGPRQVIGEADAVSCDDWHREPLPELSSVLVNNTWNAGWADAQSYSQCLLRRSTSLGPQYGWRWDWPEYRPYSSYAAPELLDGWKAWDGGVSTAPDLPRRIDALEALHVDFAVDLEADDTHNLNLTMWLTDTDEASESPNPASITNEIMVWFHNPAGLGGGITQDGEATLDGVGFDVWHLVNQPDASGSSTQTWTMVIHIAKEPHLARRFDLETVLDDAVDKGLTEPRFAVGGVELVTEVFGGRGELWLDRFSVEVVPPR